MIEIRFHGRGGQGAVTSAELLAVAAINEGKYAQAFPSFGPERRGAPVIAFARIDDAPILWRSQIYNPDVVIVLDSALPKIVDVTQGMKENGILILNTKEKPEEIRKEIGKKNLKIATVDATKIAREELGRPITNTTMLGSLIKATRILKPEAFREPMTHRFGKIADINLNALTRAYKETVILNT